MERPGPADPARAALGGRARGGRDRVAGRVRVAGFVRGTGLVRVLFLVPVLLVASVQAGCSGGEAPGAPAGASTAAAQGASAAGQDERTAAVRVLLDARADDLLAGDVAGVLDGTDPRASAFRQRQGDLARGLARLPLASWSYEVRGQGPDLGAARRAELGADDAWVADVLLSYRLAGVDDVPQLRQQSLTVVRRDGRWLLAGDRDGPGRPEPWDLGLVDVVEGERTLVVGTARRDVLVEQASLGDAAAARVDAVWGTGWPRRTVVVVPADEDQLARLLGRAGTDGLDQVAALTTGADRSSGEPGAEGAVDRVLVNPAALERLGDLGRGVVLTHETTHVAVRAGAAADAPPWLSEGFAELVAYAGPTAAAGDDVVAPEVVAADLLAAVREGRGPGTLPTAADFDPTAGDVAPAYAGALLAARTVEQRYGRPALLALVRAGTGRAPAADEAGAGEAPLPLDEAVPQVLGVTLAELEQQWRADLADLATRDA
ncbi:hypothetical protein WDZ17_07445 [Pseudokineococcus basanitobsidens]|uniref:Peptidase MA superfamily protein n=1 Tax=Pseudokineococcus basanitobsidens TaxID=1926649 RepID=A0ABU8RJ75_9ACTN